METSGSRYTVREWLSGKAVAYFGDETDAELAARNWAINHGKRTFLIDNGRGKFIYDTSGNRRELTS